MAVDVPRHASLGRCLDYLAPQSCPPGTLVRVPLGRRTVTGIAWDSPADAALEDSQLKPVAEMLTALPPLGAAWRRLVEFAASYYQRSLGELSLAAIPPELRSIDGTQLERRLTRLRKRLASERQRAQSAQQQAAQVLNAAQQAAVQALAPGETSTTLLWGVTGSGKTEVYLHEVQRNLALGRQALVLVPEINLTPQLEQRFALRFPQRVIATLHSGLTPAARLRNWLAAHLGEADIVLGTRMAIFASLPRLGVIVVDEEHDPSYKQQEGARYSARDLAVMRGHLEKVPVILGSATPSLETWHNALPQAQGQGRYRRLALPQRIGEGSMPAVKVVDLARLAERVGKAAMREQHAISPPLLQALQSRLERGEQSLVLLNRRGYAPVLHCTECGWKSACPNCSAWRVFHKVDRTLRCHHCGLTQAVPRACPDCGNLDIHPFGRGTEKLEEQLAQLLPGARVGRIDADSTRLAGSLEAQLAAVHAGEVDVLVGTQMVAKGHDFRRITLVAALNTDGALFSSDFRAAERLFALLMQAAGRAGRDARHAHASEMWVQTWHPEHPLYSALRAHDFEAFAASQLEERQAAGLPPFAHLALVRAEARDQAVAQAFLNAIAQASADVGELASAVTIYPPVPMAIARVANVERAQMLIESKSRPALQAFLSAWTPLLHGHHASHRGMLRWAVDVDPQVI